MSKRKVKSVRRGISLSGVRYLTAQGIRNIKNNRVMSLASFCILLVSLLLIGFTYLFIVNVNAVIGGVEGKNEVVVFLDDGLSDTETEIIGQSITALDNVEKAYFYSKEQGFAEMKSQIPNSEELFNYIGEDSPLPDSFRVTVRDISHISRTLMEIDRIEGVYSVSAPSEFITLLSDVRNAFSVISAVVMAALLIVCIIVISNSARASVAFRQEDITIMKLVGATDTFIKVPFFIEGVIMGVISGVCSCAITYLVYENLSELVTNTNTSLLLALGVGGLIPTGELALRYVLISVLGGAFVSGLVTSISTNKYLKV
ncbi:MAG: ABC transporter permease [Ruminococcus sp.]|nr:ABC transporter permease [Ruminococcus sp.]